MSVPRGASETPIPSLRLIPANEPDARRQDVRAAQQLLDPLGGVEHVDQPGVVVVERAARNAAQPLAGTAQLPSARGVPIRSATTTRASGPTR